MSILDIIIFLFFTGGVVVFGCSFFNKKRSSEEFTSAGRSLPGWVVGMSIFATYVSSISYLAYPGKAYMSDWNAFVFSLSIPIASYFAGMGYQNDYCNNQHRYYCLFNAGWSEGGDMDGSNSGIYFDWWCSRLSLCTDV